MQRLRNLVAGTDFSEGAEQALEVATQLALAAGAGITLVHVCEPVAGDVSRSHLAWVEGALSQVVAQHRSRGVQITSLVRHGKAWKKLDNVATDVGANLIVVGRQGAGRRRVVEIGSVATQLVLHASRSVLVVVQPLLRVLAAIAWSRVLRLIGSAQPPGNGSTYGVAPPHPRVGMSLCEKRCSGLRHFELNLFSRSGFLGERARRGAARRIAHRVAAAVDGDERASRNQAPRALSGRVAAAGGPIAGEAWQGDGP